MERSRRDLVAIQFTHAPEGTEESHKVPVNITGVPV